MNFVKVGGGWAAILLGASVKLQLLVRRETL
jgi:hypothetical protein